MIRHIVTWKLAATDEAERELAASEIIEAFDGLDERIPTLVASLVARNVNPTDINWDLVLITDFESLADLAAYQEHPDHVRAASVSRPRVADRSIVDFEV